MKKILFSIVLISGIAIMFTACSRNQAGVPAGAIDTTGLAQFQEWKSLNENESANQAVVRSSTSTKKVSNSAGTNTSGTMSSSSTNEAKVAQKKGWSKAAKYGVIGGGAGVVLGAVINKRNRVAGGAIGGAVLGGVGYAIGRAQDKKDGRL